MSARSTTPSRILASTPCSMVTSYGPSAAAKLVASMRAMRDSNIEICFFFTKTTLRWFALDSDTNARGNYQALRRLVQSQDGKLVNDLQNLAANSASFNDKPPQCHWQLKSLRSSASGIEIQHIVFRFLFRFVSVA